jgi:hypothetical protein
MWNLKAKKERQLRPYRDAIARIIADRIFILQQCIVHLLQRFDRRSSIRQKKALLLFFCLANSSYCSYLFCSAVFVKKNAGIARYAPVAKPPPIVHEKQRNK